MSDRLGRFVRRVLRVRAPAELDGEAYGQMYTQPPTGKPGDPNLNVLRRAVQDVDRLSTMFSGILALKAELARFASVTQAIQESERRLEAVREAERVEGDKLAALREQVADLEALRDAAVGDVGDIKSQLAQAAAKLGDEVLQ